MAKKPTHPIPTENTVTQETLNPLAVHPTDTKNVIAATAEKMQSVIRAAGIDPVTTVGMQEVKVIRAVFDKHLASLEPLLPACSTVSPDDPAGAKKLALQVMRIRTAAEKDRLELNKESRARIAAVDGANKVLLYVLSPVEAHLNKIVDDHAAAEQKAKEDHARLRAAQIAQYTKHVEGYDFLNMSEEVFQRLVLRVRSEKEEADKVELEIKVAREKAEKEAKEAARIAQAQAEIAHRERMAAEEESRKLREELDAKVRLEHAARVIAEEKERAENARIQRIQDQLKELSDLTSTQITADSGPILDRIASRLDEFATFQWDEMDMEAEGRIDMARDWLKAARAQAENLLAAEVKRIEEETAARKLAVASDSEKLEELHLQIKLFLQCNHGLMFDLKCAESRAIATRLIQALTSSMEEIACHFKANA